MPKAVNKENKNDEYKIMNDTYFKQIKVTEEDCIN